VINRFLKKLYFGNNFRTIIYILKFLSIFNKKYKSRISFYNFFKKRKKKYEKKILEIMYHPKIFILPFPYDAEKLINTIYNYDNLYKKNEFSSHGHVNVYQSDHNLELNPNFFDVCKNLELSINSKLYKYTDNEKLIINKLWFVITKNLGVIKKHSHFNSDFSGALYLNVDENPKKNNGLRIHNILGGIDIYRYSIEENKFYKNICNDKTFLLSPNKMDLIIFNSYIEHSVENKDSKIIDRISLPFDLIF